MLNNRVKLTNKEVRRWWAPEVFGEQRQTKEADVWSFGVLMWEVCTFGGLPYSNINIDDIQDHIKFDRQSAPSRGHVLIPFVQTSDAVQRRVRHLRPHGQLLEEGDT